MNVLFLKFIHSTLAKSRSRLTEEYFVTSNYMEPRGHSLAAMIRANSNYSGGTKPLPALASWIGG